MQNKGIQKLAILLNLSIYLFVLNSCHETALITHDHQDHFDPAIFELSKTLPQIEYILGWKYYHAGDHALWAEQLLQQFTDVLKLIKSKTKQIDLAFYQLPEVCSLNVLTTV